MFCCLLLVFLFFNSATYDLLTFLLCLLFSYVCFSPVYMGVFDRLAWMNVRVKLWKRLFEFCSTYVFGNVRHVTWYYCELSTYEIMNVFPSALPASYDVPVPLKAIDCPAGPGPAQRSGSHRKLPRSVEEPKSISTAS